MPKIRTIYQKLLWICIVGVPIPLFSQSGDNTSTANNSVKVAASEQYYNHSLMKLIFMGSNYRKEWATPVMLPTFNLAGSGMKIIKLGGGQQTKSLQLLDKNNAEWVLRTIDKDVTGAIPKKYRNKVTISIVQDMVSAAHPYAPLVIPALARSTGVAAADPVFYYVPGDNAFGEYRNLFAGTVCMLERREILPGNPTTLDTKEMLDELLKRGYFSISRIAYLKARLLDMLIADWDRHHEQWIWAVRDSGGNKMLLPLPKDRDQAFFFSQGLLVKLTPISGVKHLVGLQKTTRKIKNLNAKSWNLDKLILGGLNENEWQSVVNTFVAALPDSVIESAVRRMPPEIYPISGEELQNKLIRRRNTLAEDVMEYYHFLSNTVVLYGSDQTDHFTIQGTADSLIISVTNGKGKRSVLQRVILPGTTTELDLLGFGGDDTFTVTGEIPQSILVKIDGGTGNNAYPAITDERIKKYDSDLDAAKYKTVLYSQLRIKPE